MIRPRMAILEMTGTFPERTLIFVGVLWERLELRFRFWRHVLCVSPLAEPVASNTLTLYHSSCQEIIGKWRTTVSHDSLRRRTRIIGLLEFGYWGFLASLPFLQSLTHWQEIGNINVIWCKRRMKSCQQVYLIGTFSTIWPVETR